MGDFIKILLVFNVAMPIAIPILYWMLAEKVRSEGYLDEIELIFSVRITHGNAHLEGQCCETTVKSIVAESHNNTILKLYYLDLPRVSRYAESLSTTNIWLYFGASISLYIGHLLAFLMGKKILDGKVDGLETLLAEGGLLVLLGVACFMWKFRFLPIRAFSNQLKKIRP